MADVVPAGKFVSGDVEHLAGGAPVEEFFDEIAQRFLRRGVAVGEVFQDGEVFAGGEDLALRGLAIASGAADFLGVVLDALGQVVVVDRTDVGLVDAHAEGDGRHHHGVVAGHEAVLHGLAGLRFHAGVVGFGRIPGFGQSGGDRLGGFLQGNVDNGRALGAGTQALQQHAQAFIRGAGGGAQGEVGPVKPGVHVGGRLDREGVANVLSDRRRGGGGEREHAPDVELAGKAR